MFLLIRLSINSGCNMPFFFTRTYNVKHNCHLGILLKSSALKLKTDFLSMITHTASSLFYFIKVEREFRDKNTDQNNSYKRKTQM